jgi:hypothetical protein
MKPPSKEKPRATRNWRLHGIIGLSLIAILSGFIASYAKISNLGEPAWKKELSKVALHVFDVDKPGGIPREQKMMINRCNADILQRDHWTMKDCDELFALIDYGFQSQERWPEGSNERALQEMFVEHPFSTIATRFHHGAPVDRDVADRVRRQFIELTKADDYSLRLSALTGAIYGRMDTDPAVSAALLKLQDDGEPLIASVARKYSMKLESAEWVRLRDEKVRERGY